MFRKIIFTIQNALRWTCLILIQGYQKFISPFLGNHCRFYPSCSEYAKEVMRSHSVVKSLYLIVWRLLRCHPFCKGGVDFPKTPTSTPTHTTR